MSMFDIDELLKDNSKPVSETAWLGDIDIMEGTLSNFNLDIDQITESGLGEIGEKPSGHPYDANSIPIPNKKEIDVQTYNDALTRLQNSFNETVKFMKNVSINYNIVEHTSENLAQDFFTDRAIFESYCDGPYFEKVSAENKHEIKALAKRLRKRLLDQAHNINGIGATISHKLRLLSDIIGSINPLVLIITIIKYGFDMWIIDPILISKFNNNRLNLYAWQTICYLYGRSYTLGDLKKKLNNEFADVLGEKYEIEIIKMKFFYPTIRGKKELDEYDKGTDSNYFNNYLLIVNEKGTPIPNREETIHLKGEKAAKYAAALKLTEDIEPSSESSIKSGFNKLIEKIKSKISRKKKDEDKSDDE